MPPVGIVVVSHSGPLAEATVSLVASLTNLEPSDVALVAAGGLAGGETGTDAARIADAIRAADRGTGVVILADLGSAVLSAATAVEELLSEELAQRVRISNGPLVEGAFVAALQASTGDSLEAVLAAADGAAHLEKMEPSR